MSSPSYPCRWKWCRSILKSTSELREHIRDHVRDEKSCRVRELVEQLRAEEGIGQSISLGLGSYSQVSLQGSGSSTRPVLPPASTSSLANALSPPAQYIVSPGPETTPRISQIASRSTSAIPNPEIPDLDTLLSGALSVPNKQLFSTPVSSPSRLRISRSQDSDSSVERQLTQEMDMSFDGPASFSQQDPYAGEIVWAGSQSQSQPQSQSQSQSTSSSQSSPPTHRPTASSSKQSWYGSPSRTSSQSRTPARSFMSGSIRMPSAPRTVNPLLLSQSSSSDSSYSFVPQTQAPYRSQGPP